MKYDYEDIKTGLKIKKIDYENRDEAFADIRVISSCLDKFREFYLVPEKIALFYQIGVHERLDWLGCKTDYIREFNIETYAVFFNNTIISTPTITFVDNTPYINLWVLDEYFYKYIDILKVLGNFLKLRGYKKVFLIYPKGLKIDGIENIAKFVREIKEVPNGEIYELIG